MANAFFPLVFIVETETVESEQQQEQQQHYQVSDGDVDIFDDDFISCENDGIDATPQQQNGNTVEISPEEYEGLAESGKTMEEYFVEKLIEKEEDDEIQSDQSDHQEIDVPFTSNDMQFVPTAQEFGPSHFKMIQILKKFGKLPLIFFSYNL